MATTHTHEAPTGTGSPGLVKAALVAGAVFLLWKAARGLRDLGWAAFGLGLLAGGVGGLIALWGLIGLGRNLTPLPHPVADGELVTHGPYRIVRHPIYSGVILGSLGWSLLWASPWLILLSAGLFVFFDIKSRREEIWLRRAYSGYADYATRTRKLIPFIY